MRAVIPQKKPRWIYPRASRLVGAILFSTALALPQGPALAGPNAGGTLILSEFSLVPTCFDYCDYEDPVCGDIRNSCDDFLTRWDSTEVTAVKIYAAFDETAVPSLAAVAVGIDHPGSEELVVVFDGGGCGESVEATADWPAPGSGVRVTFGPARTDLFVGVYYLGAYSYYGSTGTVSLTPHPSLPAVFEDGSDPPILDDIVDYGAFGFFEDGFLPCPIAVLGACCIGTECEVLSFGACAEASGEYRGDDVPCDPQTCELVPVIETSWGRIKGNMR